MKKMRVMAFLLSTAMVLSEVPAGYVMAMENEVAVEQSTETGEEAVSDESEDTKKDVVSDESEDTEKENILGESEDTEKENISDESEDTEKENVSDESEVTDEQQVTEQSATDEEKSAESMEEKATGEPLAKEDVTGDSLQTDGHEESDADEKLDAEQAGTLNVAYHTQEEIKSFIKTSGAGLDDAVSYASKPNTTAGSYAPGKLSDTTQNSAIAMLNQIRYVAGISYNIAYNDYYQKCAQAVALTNFVNKQLSHYPTQPAGMDDELFALAEEGGSSGNLAYYYASWGACPLNTMTVTQWMGDSDQYNIDRVGHRRWVINPKMTKAAFGAVTDGYTIYAAMYAHDRVGTGTETQVAWPAQNMPTDYFSSEDAWSISMGTSVTKSTTSVKLTRKKDNKVWNFSSESADGDFYVDNAGYGQSGCIIFRPIETINGVKKYVNYAAGDSFDVHVEYNSKTVDYTVNFFDLTGGEAPAPEEDTYTITYVLDGGTNHTSNPVEYKKSSATITLKDPTKEGYDFKGWYKESTFVNKVTEIKTGSTGNMTLYAKWEKKQETPTPGPTSALNVTYHTQSAIANYIKQSGAGVNQKITYQKTPNTTPEYYDPGKLSAETQNSAMAMLNQVRYIAGIPYNVSLDTGYEEAVQAASLVMYANGTLSHQPSKPVGMDDYTYNLGYQGASRSNIAVASQGTSINYSILHQWMADDDNSNIDRLGHRRWMLNPVMEKTAFGAVDGPKGMYTAVYAFDRNGTSQASQVVWPAQNMPVQYFDPAYPWSISMGSYVDIETVSVKLTKKANQKTWNFSKASADGYFNVDNQGYGQSGCIIFRPSSVGIKAGDVFDVEIQYNGKTISYSVNFFDLANPGSEPEAPTYKITYVLDGGTNSPENPSEYMESTETILLKPATKKDYVFGGWYTDKGFTNQMTKIEKGSKGDITLYAKWLEGNVLPAMSFTVTNVFDSSKNKVLNTQDNKPAIYVFGSLVTGKETVATLKMINDMVGDMDADTNIYCFDNSWGTDEDFLNMFLKSKKYSERMTISLIDSREADSFFDICSKIAGGVREEQNCILFKDAQNKIAAFFTDEVLLSDMQLGLNKAQIAYKDYYHIDYELYGGVNNADNPTLYKATDETIVLKDPTRSGYQFEGWYTDNAFKNQITEIKKGTTGNLVIYAKWIRNTRVLLNEYNVTLTDARNSSKSKVLNTRDNKPAVYLFGDVTGCPHTRAGMSDLSQILDTRVTQDVNVFVMDINQDDTDAAITAKLSSEGISNKIIVSKYNKEVDDFLVDMLQTIGKRTIYNPMIVYKDANNKMEAWSMTERPQKEIVANMVAAGIPVQGTEGMKVYQIYYELNGGGTPIANPWNYTNKTEPIKLLDGTSDTMKFKGWYLESSFVTRITQIDNTMSGDITLYAKWGDKNDDQLDAPTASVASGSKVKKGTKISLSTSEAGATIKYTLKATDTKDQFTTYTTPIVVEDDVTIRAFVTKSGMKDSDITEFEYTVGKCKVSFDSNGGTEIADIMVNMGETVAEPTEPVKEGYTFVGWFLNGKQYYFDQLVESDIVLVAQWKEKAKLDQPTVSVREGEVETGTKIQLRHSNNNAVIRYTTNGTEPTAKTGTVYSGSIVVSKDMTIKAAAFAAGYKDSDVAVFTYTVKEKSSLWGDVDPEEVPEKGIPEGMWIAGIKDMVFTGVAVKPVVHVYDGKKLLREKKDYTIAYRNNIKVASATGITDMATAKAMKTPTVIITGKGNYGDKIEQYFSITSKNINDVDVVADDIVCKYAKNKVQKVVPTITYQGKKLVKGKDFDVLFEDTAAGAYKEVGVYSVVVTGKNNFEGTRTIKLVITQKLPVGKLVVKKIADQSFAGEAVEPVLDVRYAGKVLTEGVDYRVSFENNVRCGEAHAIIKGMDRFYGERRVSFKIVEPYRNGKYDIAQDTMGVMEYRFANVNEYMKGGCKPELTVLCDGKVLVEGTDYAVAYKNFAKADDLVKVPTITITGKGQYKGKHEETYKIVQKDITTKAMLTSENEVRMLGADSENTNILFVAADKVYNAKKNGYTTKLMVYDFNGVAMKAGVDFDKNVEYRYKEKTVLADGTVRNAGAFVESEDIMAMGTVLTVTIHGIGNYKGSSTAEYRLIEKAMDISGANAKVNTTKILQYTGKNIELTESDIEVKLRNEFVASSNYRIIGYRNNRKKGSAEVMISGIGNFGGLKVVKFAIGAKKIVF